MDKSKTPISIILIKQGIYCEMLLDTLAEVPGLEMLISFDSMSPAALQAVHRFRPDIVLLDVLCPDSVDAIESSRNASANSLVVVFDVPDQDYKIIEYAAAGASGYISHDANMRDWVDAIFGTIRGDVKNARIAGVLNRYLFRLFAPAHKDDRMAARNRCRDLESPADSKLTRREIQVISLVDKGFSNKEIARELNVCVSTVKNHVHAILRKYRVQRRTQAAVHFRRANSIRNSSSIAII